MLDVLDTFHEKLLQAAGNQMLASYLQSLRSRLRRLRGISLKQHGRARQTIEEKRILLDVLKQRDGELARKAREQHVLTAAKNVTAVLADQPPHLQNGVLKK
jgi:DNA-binding GntR family transcriptional regulator